MRQPVPSALRVELGLLLQQPLFSVRTREDHCEPVVEVKEQTSPKKVKTLELVKCQKCNKEMTKRTLRYDHDKTCKGAPIKREDVPVQKRVKKVVEEKQPPPQVIIPEHIIEQEIKKRIQSTVQDRVQQRMKLKEERIKKLSAHIAKIFSTILYINV